MRLGLLAGGRSVYASIPVGRLGAMHLYYELPRFFFFDSRVSDCDLLLVLIGE